MAPPSAAWPGEASRRPNGRATASAMGCPSERQSTSESHALSARELQRLLRLRTRLSVAFLAEGGPILLKLGLAGALLLSARECTGNFRGFGLGGGHRHGRNQVACF